MNHNAKKRFAFIDVYNTTNTTERVHNFVIDWIKLYHFLEDRWKCEKIFFYSGIEIGDLNTEKEYKSYEELGYEMKIKPIMSFKRPDKTIHIICSNCRQENTKIVPMGYNKKSNCDSELTVDALELVQPETEMLFFTGDGDFTYLIKKLVEKGVSISVISSMAKEIQTHNRRFSKSLRDMIKKREIDFIEINNLREVIKKTVEISEE